MHYRFKCLSLKLLIIVIMIIICVNLPLFCTYADNKRLARLFIRVFVLYVSIVAVRQFIVMFDMKNEFIIKRLDKLAKN